MFGLRKRYIVFFAGTLSLLLLAKFLYLDRRAAQAPLIVEVEREEVVEASAPTTA